MVNKAICVQNKRYIYGDKNQIDLIKMLNNEIDLYKKSFFGY